MSLSRKERDQLAEIIQRENEMVLKWEEWSEMLLFLHLLLLP